MSWDSYIDNLKGQCQDNCDLACIIGIDGSIWTTEGHASALKITPAEAKTIGTAYQSKDFKTFMASGVHVAGVKYQFLREDDDVVLAKKKDQGAITMQKSKTAVVVAHVIEGKSQGAVNKGVGVIADYLISLNM